MPRNSTRKSENVIVIGAGASGLAAAQALRGCGIPVRIIEKAHRAGDGGGDFDMSVLTER